MYLIHHQIAKPKTKHTINVNLHIHSPVLQLIPVLRAQITLQILLLLLLRRTVSSCDNRTSRVAAPVTRHEKQEVRNGREHGEADKSQSDGVAFCVEGPVGFEKGVGCDYTADF